MQPYAPPPPGYPDPYQQQMQQQQQQMQGYGPPPMQGQPGASVLGIPLEPGERVIWFKKHDYTTEKVINWILGVLFAVVLIGFLFIYLAVTMDSRNPKAHILTNRRFIVIPGTGAPQMYALQQVADVEPQRQRVQGGGGLIGLAISAAATAVANSMADNNHKLQVGYWARTEAIILITHHGQRVNVATRPAYGQQLGWHVARATLGREADHMAPVQHLP